MIDRLVSIKQDALRPKIEAYLKCQGRDVNLAIGYCHGLAVLWLYNKSKNKEKNFFDQLEKIAKWDGKEDIDHVFEDYIHDVEWFQRQHDLLGLRQVDVEQAMEMVLEENVLFEKGIITFGFTQEELKKVFHALIQEGDYITLHSNFHALALIKENGKFKFYDSNNPNGAVEFETIDDLFKDADSGLIKALMLESTRVKQTEIEGIRCIPMAIKLMSKNPQSKLKDEDLVKLLEDIVEKRKDNHNRISIDERGLSKVTGLSEACRKRDVKSALFLLKNGANPNLSDRKGAPLSYAINVGDLKLIQHLIYYGAEIQDKHLKGHKDDPRLLTYLHLANYLKNDNPQGFMTYLSEHPDDVKNIENEMGISWLHLALKMKSPNMVACILENNLSDLSQLDPENKMPIDLARESKVNGMIRMLEGDNLYKAIIGKERETVINLLNENHPIHINILYLCVNNFDEQIFKAILEKIQPGSENEKIIFKTAIIRAIQIDSGEALQLLLERNNEIIKLELNREKQSVFHLAAKYGREEMLTHLLSSPGFTRDELNKKDTYGNTPLHYAAQSGNLNTIKFLLAHQAEIKENNDGNHPLNEAIKNKQTEAALYLIENLPIDDLKKINNEKLTPINLVAKTYDADGIKLINALISKGMDIYSQDASGNSDQMLRHILSLDTLGKLDVNQKDSKGMSPLFVAVENNNINALKLLIEKGGDILSETSNGESLLSYAVRFKKREIVEILMSNDTFLQSSTPLPLDSVSNPETKNTVIFWGIVRALQKNEYDAMTLLLLEHKEYSLNTQNKNGETLLHIAIKMGDEKALNRLLNFSKGEVNRPNHDNQTPLILACKLKQPGMVKALLEANAYVHTRADYGLTALHYALENNDLESAELLLRHNANPNAVSVKNITPKQIAANNPAAKELIERMEQLVAAEPQPVIQPIAEQQTEKADERFEVQQEPIKEKPTEQQPSERVKMPESQQQPTVAERETEQSLTEQIQPFLKARPSEPQPRAEIHKVQPPIVPKTAIEQFSIKQAETQEEQKPAAIHTEPEKNSKKKTLSFNFRLKNLAQRIRQMRSPSTRVDGENGMTSVQIKDEQLNKTVQALEKRRDRIVNRRALFVRSDNDKTKVMNAFNTAISQLKKLTAEEKTSDKMKEILKNLRDNLDQIHSQPQEKEKPTLQTLLSLFHKPYDAIDRKKVKNMHSDIEYLERKTHTK